MAIEDMTFEEICVGIVTDAAKCRSYLTGQTIRFSCDKILDEIYGDRISDNTRNHIINSTADFISG